MALPMQAGMLQIIDADLFDAVGAKLEPNRINSLNRARADQPSLLAGLLWDAEGRRMSPNHAFKATRRYRYYVHRQKGADRKIPAWRIHAGDVEHLVISKLRSVPDAADTIVPDQPVDRQWLQRTAERIEVRRDRILITVLGNEVAEPILVSASIIRRGKETRLALALDGGDRMRDPSLIKLIVKAHVAREALRTAGDRTVAELATAHGYSRDYFGVLLRIRYLDPDIIAAILDGRQPVQLNRQRLARATNLPVDWQGQRQMLGFA